jgi:hypothetical protein
MDWQTLGTFDSGSVPDITLDPGTYRFLVGLPLEPPDFITGIIYHGLRAVGLNCQGVDKSGAILAIVIVV